MTNKLTIKDLERFYNNCEHFKRGYCCYQESGKSKYDMMELGYNSGVYGWNWTLYLDTETDTLYCSCYRNVPDRFIERQLFG